MNIQHLTGTLVDKRELCTGTYEFTFSFAERISVIPGAYTYLTLPYLVSPDDRGPRRHISLVSASSELQQIKIAVRIRNTGFKQTLIAMPIGTTIDITKPHNDIVLPDNVKTPLVFIAGGIGITPFMHMLSWMYANNRTTEVTLLYYNQRMETTAYYTELKNLAKSMQNFNPVFIMTQDKSWSGERGRIDSDTINTYISDIQTPIFYTVGPEGMNQAVEMILGEMGVSEDQFIRQDFTGY